MVKLSSVKWALQNKGRLTHLELHLEKDRGKASLRSTSFILTGLEIRSHLCSDWQTLSPNTNETTSFRRSGIDPSQRSEYSVGKKSSIESN